MKQYFIILAALGLLLSTANAQDDLSRKKISNTKVSAKSNAPENIPPPPPPPGDDDWGDPIPINGGIALIIGLSSAYFLTSKKKKTK